MSGYISFEEVKANVRIEDAMQRLGLDMRKSGPDQYRGVCPTCKTGGERALSVNTAKRSFYCFPARAGGDVIGLTAHIQGLSQKEAAEWLVGTVHSAQSREAEAHSSPSPTPAQGFQPLDYLEPSHDAVDAVGFPADVAEAVGIGFAPKGILRGLVAVPVRLPDGQLIGYIGIDQAKLPNQWHLERKVVPLQRRA